MDKPQPRVLEIDFETRHGRLRGRLAVPPGEVSLAEFAYNVMGLDDRLVSMAVAAEARAGRQVSCRKGCGACCRQAVPLSPAEAFLIADLVASLPPERRAVILERFASANRRLAEAGFGDRSTSVSAGEAEVFALGRDYFRLGIPCPFLEDEACSIHAGRPSACREFLVTSPPENCSDPGGKPMVGVPLAASVTEALSRLSARALGGEPLAIPLTLALEWAAENREAAARRYDAAELMGALFQELGPREPEAGAQGSGADAGG